MGLAKYIGLAATLVCGMAASQAAVQPLRLCADPANLPFSSNAPEAVDKGAPGLYVEIGHAVAEELGRPMETVWSLSYFGKRNIRTTLLAGQCDLMVGLPADSDFMGPRVIFTRPILKLGYALVVPKEHYENLYDLEDPAGLDIHRLTRRIAIALKEAFACDGTSTRQHNEPAGNQDLWHLHVHVFPRYHGDDLYGAGYRDSTYEERLALAARLQAVL